MKRREYAWMLLAAVCLPALIGCPISNLVSPDMRTVEREVNLDGKTVTVIPFKDQRQPYFESADGMDLAQAVSAQFRMHVPTTRVVSPQPIREKYEPLELEKVGVDKLGEATGAQLILVGDIKQFTVQDPNSIGVLRGTCQVDLLLFDTATRKQLWTRSLTIHYPEVGMVPEGDLSRATMRERLIAAASDEIARKFYTYKEPDRPPRMPM